MRDSQGIRTIGDDDGRLQSCAPFGRRANMNGHSHGEEIERKIRKNGEGGGVRL